MKKLISIIALGTIVLAGCAKFQEEATPEFAPAADPVISEVEFDDYTLTATVTPAEGTAWYSWAIIAGSDAIDGEVLLKNSEKAIVKGTANAAEKASVVITAKGLSPNTTYTVYAVAANSQGVVSDVVSVTKTTSDKTYPALSNFDSEVEGSAMTLWAKFDEAVTLTGKGAATAFFYAINSTADEDGVLSPAYEVNIPVETLIEDGQWVGFPIPEEEYQPGAYVFLTFTAGIVKNAVGLENVAYSNHICTVEGPERGICEQFDEVEWNLAIGEFDGKGFVAFPEDTTVFFSDWESLQIIVAPADEETVLAPAASEVEYEVVYSEASGRKISYPSAPYKYYPSYGFYLCFLDEAPEYGSSISISIPAECAQDVWGNPSAALEAEDLYFCSYGFDIDDFTGVFEFSTIGYFAKATVVDTVNVEPAVYDPKDYEEGDPEYDIMLTGTINGIPIAYPVYGWIDGDSGKLILENEVIFFEMEHPKAAGYTVAYEFFDYSDSSDQYSIAHNNPTQYATQDWLGVYLYVFDPSGKKVSSACGYSEMFQGWEGVKIADLPAEGDQMSYCSVENRPKIKMSARNSNLTQVKF